MRSFTLSEEEIAHGQALLAASGRKLVVFRREPVQHNMFINHCFHSPLWFWNRGYKKHAIAQVFINLVVSYASLLFWIKLLTDHEVKAEEELAQMKSDDPQNRLRMN